MRQMCRLRDVRAPDHPNADQLTQAQVRQMADYAVTLEQYNSALISQIRLAQASQGWTQPPTPASGTGGTNANGYPSVSGREILGEVPDGARDGVNQEFVLQHYAQPQTVKVFYNSLRLGFGNSLDYVVLESITGQGFDTIRLTGAQPPRSRDRIWVDYLQA